MNFCLQNTINQLRASLPYLVSCTLAPYFSVGKGPNLSYMFAESPFDCRQTLALG